MNETAEAELRARVERAATFLDQAEPRWWKRVEHELQMSSCHKCVLGQLFGGGEDAFESALDKFVGSDDDAERLAWAIRHGFDIVGGYVRYLDLDPLWLEAIQARRVRA